MDEDERQWYHLGESHARHGRERWPSMVFPSPEVAWCYDQGWQTGLRAAAWDRLGNALLAAPPFCYAVRLLNWLAVRLGG